MNKNRNKNIIISGFALFSMFFGAGNLLFAPALGEAMGKAFIPSMIGFITAGVGLVMMGAIASMKAGGSILEASSIVNPTFGQIFSTVTVLAIGPGLAIPRTAATTYEVISKGLMPNLSPVLSSTIFFILVLLFVYKPSKVVSNLGRFLTPMLLIVLGIIIVKGFIHPIGTPTDKGIVGAFGIGFEEGYQTMDALAALIFARIIYDDFVTKGYSDKKEILGMTIKSAIIAGVGLSVIYIGLVFIGASASGEGISDLGRTEMLIHLTGRLLGKFGNIALSLSMALACLTTAIGLTAYVGEYFSSLFKNKISYNVIILISSVFAAITSVRGVDNIVAISAPILVALYPTAIVIIFLNTFIEHLGKRGILIGSIIGSLIPAVNTILNSIFGNIDIFKPLEDILPKSLVVFSWVVPVVVLAIIFNIIYKGKKQTA